MGIAKKLSRLFGELGFAASCMYLLGKVLRTLCIGNAVRYELQCVDLAALAQNPKSVALEKLEEDTCFSEVLDAPDDVIKERLAQGGICLGLRDKTGQLVAWLWYIAGRYNEDEVDARFSFENFPGGAVWDFGVFVIPEKRIGRTFQNLWIGFAQAMQSQEIGHSLSRIASHNVSSINAHRRLPHKVLGYCLFFRVLGLQLAFSSLQPKMHFSFGRAGMPHYSLGPERDPS